MQVQGTALHGALGFDVCFAVHVEDGRAIWRVDIGFCKETIFMAPIKGLIAHEPVHSGPRQLPMLYRPSFLVQPWYAISMCWAPDSGPVLRDYSLD